MTEDGKQLVYAVSAHDTAKNGVFAVGIGSNDAPVALLSGKGKYLKLTWDEDQTELAFLSDKDDAASKPSKFKLYRWDRRAPAATELVSEATPGFHKDFVISENGAIGFSKDGKHVYFGVRRRRRRKRRTMPPPIPAKKKPWWIFGLTRTSTCSRRRNCAPRAIATAPSLPRTRFPITS